MPSNIHATRRVKQTARSTPRVATGAVRAVVARMATALSAAGRLDSAASPAAAVAEAAAEQEEQYDHDDEDREHEPRTGLSG
jgi:hypothetical protein